MGGSLAICNQYVLQLQALGFKATSMKGPLIRPSSGKYPLHQPAGISTMSKVVSGSFRAAHDQLAALGIEVPDVRRERSAGI